MPVVIQRSKRYREAAKKQVIEPMAVDAAVDLLARLDEAQLERLGGIGAR